jgi:hypothetical protein
MAACDTGKMVLFVWSVLWDLGVPQEAATLLYKDNGGCTAMGNARKPTPRTRHIDIKYFTLCEWVKHDLLLLDRIDTSINMADHLTKALSPTLFHRHADFLLGHVPPQYSPIYDNIVGTYKNHTVDMDKFIPQSFTTPITAAVARVCTPLWDDYAKSPWLSTIWHGFQSTIPMDSHLLYIADCGGVLPYRIVDS